MNRTPPIAVRRQLRKEVAFGCPVPGCGNPYLEWHHFDPPWHEREHHEPKGIVALCSRHHPMADSGAFTIEQLRAFKSKAIQADVSGRFEWQRHKLLAVVGGCFNYEPVNGKIVEINGKPFVTVTRDENGYMLVNVYMPTISGQPRLVMEENYWLLRGDANDFECPPSGRLIAASYPNGDSLRIEFADIETASEASDRFKGMKDWHDIEFPLTSVEVTCVIGGTGFIPFFLVNELSACCHAYLWE